MSYSDIQHVHVITIVPKAAKIVTMKYAFVMYVEIMDANLSSFFVRMPPMTITSRLVFQRIVRPWVNASWTAMTIRLAKLLVFQFLRTSILNVLVRLQ